VSQWQCRLGPSRNGQWRYHYGDASVVTAVSTCGVAFAASHRQLDVKRAKLRLWQRRGYHGHYRWRGKADGDAAATGADGKISYSSVWRRNMSVLWPEALFGTKPRPGSEPNHGLDRRRLTAVFLSMWPGMAAAVFGAGRGCVFVGRAAAEVDVGRNA
jgi:hypothetical protein